MGWFLLGILALVAILVLIILVRTFQFKSPQANSSAAPYDPGEVAPEVLERLGKAISIPCISIPDYENTDFGPFEDFIRFLEEAYPLFHKTCTMERVNGYGLVYRWQGADAARQPMMLTAHYDVVPVEAGTEDEWKYPGFSGQVAEGRVWGRGTLDIKSQITAHMEAAENLMRGGFVPERDFYFVYGHDEENGGRQGAYKLCDWFVEKGIRLEGVLDEGGFAVEGVLKGVDSPLAMIGVAEKGFCNLELSVGGMGGHSSMPPVNTAMGNAAKLVCAIENNPMPASLTPPTEKMLRNIAGEMGFVVKMAVANLWLFKPVLMKILAKNPATNALIRTTTAPTMAKASDAANVLPQRAKIVVNSRVLPGDTVDGMVNHIKALGAGLDLETEKLVSEEPSAVSPADSAVYYHLEATIRELFPNVIATPYLVMGGTDARKYYAVCDNVLRFTPMLITNEERGTLHNTNESVTIDNYGRMIYFFERFIKDFDNAR